VQRAHDRALRGSGSADVGLRPYGAPPALRSEVGIGQAPVRRPLSGRGVNRVQADVALGGSPPDTGVAVDARRGAGDTQEIALPDRAPDRLLAVRPCSDAHAWLRDLGDPGQHILDDVARPDIAVG